MCRRCVICGVRTCREGPYEADTTDYLIGPEWSMFMHSSPVVGWIRVYPSDHLSISEHVFNTPKGKDSVRFVCSKCKPQIRITRRVPTLVSLAAFALYGALDYENKTYGSWHSFLKRRGLGDVLANTPWWFAWKRCAGANDPDDINYVKPHITPYPALPIDWRDAPHLMRKGKGKKKVRVPFSYICVDCMQRQMFFHRRINFSRLMKELRLLDHSEIDSKEAD